MRLASAFKLAIVFGRGVAVRGLFGEGIYLIEIFLHRLTVDWTVEEYEKMVMKVVKSVIYAE